MKKIFSVFIPLVIFLGVFHFSELETRMSVVQNVASSVSDSALSDSSSNINLPTVLESGEDFNLYGTFSSTKPLYKAILKIEDLNQFTTDFIYELRQYTSKVEISDFDSYIDFSTLSSGEKRLTLQLVSMDDSVENYERDFTILGETDEPYHITDSCEITADSGDVTNVTDNSIVSNWNGGTMTINFPKDKTVDGFQLKFFSVANSYNIKTYGQYDNLIEEYTSRGNYFLHRYFPVSSDAVKAVIKYSPNKTGRGIVNLRVYEKDKVGVSVERWEQEKQSECDLLVVSCHRDDELLFFGGTIPYYKNVMAKNVHTMYVSGGDRERVREALAGQWAMGIHNYPTFLFFEGGYHRGVEGTIDAWGGEEKCLERMVNYIRYYQPKVIVTHAEDGEYGHPSHRATSYLVSRAVELAKDEYAYPDSLAKYGAWEVKKLYKHCYEQNILKMNWDVRYARLDSKTPLEMTRIGFDKHRSQHYAWSLDSEQVKNNPNDEFGLVYSTVGDDVVKNDFFENID